MRGTTTQALHLPDDMAWALPQSLSTQAIDCDMLTSSKDCVSRNKIESLLVSLATPALPSHITIEPITESTIPDFKRLLLVLLPTASLYRESFFTDILSDPSIAAISRIAVWHERLRLKKRKRREDDESLLDESREADIEDKGVVVGSIRCRLEPVPCPPDAYGPVSKNQIYVQTLAVLSPYRMHGIATHLLDRVIVTALKKFENVTSIYAHAWENNQEGLEWYARRGFMIEEEVVAGYYRRLKPSGARIVRRQIGINDHLKAKDVK